MHNHIDYTVYPIDAVVQVYNVMDGWQRCRVTRHDWDHMYGRPTFHVALVDDQNIVWITNSQYMRSE